MDINVYNVNLLNIMILIQINVYKNRNKNKHIYNVQYILYII